MLLHLGPSVVTFRTFVTFRTSCYICAFNRPFTVLKTFDIFINILAPDGLQRKISYASIRRLYVKGEMEILIILQKHSNGGNGLTEK